MKGLANAFKREPLESRLVFVLWFACAAIVLAYVSKYGSQIPFQDDWSLIWRIEKSAEYILWDDQILNGAHRIPTTSALLSLVWRVTNGSIKPALFVNAGFLILVSLYLLSALRRYQGSLQITDAAIPLFVLSLGQATNLIWGIQSFFIASSCIVLFALGTSLKSKHEFSNGLALLFSILIVMLPLQGGMGILQTPAIILVGGYRMLFGVQSKFQKYMLLVAIIISALIVADFFCDRVTEQGVDISIRRLAWVSLSFLSLSLGTFGSAIGKEVGLAVTGFLFVSLVMMMATYRAESGLRSKIIMIAFILAGLGLLTVGLAVGRSGGGAGRYSTLIMPLLCALYFYWAIAPHSKTSIAARHLLLVAALVPSGYDYIAAREFGTQRLNQTMAFEGDIRNGRNLGELTSAHAPYWQLDDEERFARYLGSAIEAGRELYRDIDLEDRRFRTKAVPGVPTYIVASAEEQRLVLNGSADHIAFDVPSNGMVSGIAVVIEYIEARGVEKLRLEYMGRGCGNGRFARCSVEKKLNLMTKTRKKTVSFLFNDVVDAFAIFPCAEQCTIKLHRVDWISY